MMFINSLKLFGSNWSKTLKLFLYYLAIWGICFALFLPCFFEFKDIFIENYSSVEFLGVFESSFGWGLKNAITIFMSSCLQVFNANIGLAIYALIVVFIFLPFLLNLGKYTFQLMLYSYMTSKAQVGFFSAMVKSLKRSVVFSICKTFYNLLLCGLLVGVIYGLIQVNNAVYIEYFFGFTCFLILTVIYALNLVSVLGWSVASIVFDCNVFSAYKKGIKAVKRHFWSIFGVAFLYFALFWAIVMILGIYAFLVLIPFISIALYIYNMVAFFTSQGMRYYVNSKQILTPKKLEEVDNINKTASIL